MPAEHRDTQEVYKMSTKQMGEVIQNYLHSRLGIEVMTYFVRSKKDVGAVGDIAKAIKRDEQEVRRMCKQLTTRTVLKSIGGDVYNFATEAQLQEQITQTVKRWQVPQERHRLFPFLKEEEQKKAGFFDKLLGIFKK